MSFKTMFREGYPASGKPPGVCGQRYELETGIFRSGSKTAITKLREALAGVLPFTDGMRVLEIGCRQGASTHGLLDAALPAKIDVLATDPIDKAMAVARLRFGRGYPKNGILLVMSYCLGNHPTGDEAKAWLDQLPGELWKPLMEESRAYQSRVEFIDPPDHLYAYGPFSLVYGYQTGHWIETDSDGEYQGYPKAEHLKNISDAVAPGKYIYLGYSTAFFDVDPELQVDGMNRSQYAIDEHPFFKHYIATLVRHVAAETGKSEEEVVRNTVAHSATPKPNESGFAKYLEGIGLKLVSIIGYLVTPGAEKVVTDVAEKRPIHQGYLKFVPEPERARLIQTSLEEANRIGANLIRHDATNIYDIVPMLLIQRL
mgnify:CR=1 FL=1